MIQRKLHIAFAFIIIQLHVFAAATMVNVNVRLFSNNLIRSFILSPIEGSYDVYANGKLLSDCDASCLYQITIENELISVKTFEQDLGKFESIKLVKKTGNASFKIKCIIPASTVRTYDDDLEIKLLPDKSQFLLINRVGINSYIAGVVQSESGKRNNSEYYKLQAILCRTYLLSHSTRHASEGFELCDDVHCQAYLSRATEKRVKDAVAETSGLVVVDNDLNLITAAFHSNCGGETCNSEDVWSLRTTYLRSVKDTFCVHKVNANWKKTITLQEWKSYLKLKGKVAENSNFKLGNMECIKEGSERTAYYVDGDFKLSVKTIRNDLKLRSAYFLMEVKNDSVIFNGKGYGHGVGLCQEGAMEMSKKQYNYPDILRFYYKDVNIVDLESLTYFKQE
jgi:stage II sporulation protein D